MDDLLPDFLVETAENLQQVDNEIVRFEREPSDVEVLANIFRMVHTVKGSCGFIGLPRLEQLAHAAETLLGKLRDGTLKANPAIVTETLAAIDAIRIITAALAETGKEPETDNAELINRLEALARGETVDGAPAEAPTAAASNDMASQSIRVSVSLLEELMTSVSELVLTRNQLMQEHKQAGHDEMDPPLQRLSAQIYRLQDSVMRTRMQPISGAWNVLPRIVRQLGIDLDKSIDLVMEGGETELDRQMLEMIKDPLTHMVRNSGDHGIETRTARLAAGKPPAGTIHLSAAQEGGHITIDLSDDGCGLNLPKLKEKAVEHGVLTSAQADEASDMQLARLIFMPGMSTAKEVTQISGRGVGMDIVRANIEKIGGTIEVDTKMGEGTRFRIRIPLTLAIMPALIIGVGPEKARAHFAIPQIAVAELVRTDADSEHRVETVAGARVIRLRGRLLPLIDLGHTLGMPGGATDHVLIIRGAGNEYGVLVDEVFDTEELVVKPVSHPLAGLSLYAGNAILGDGQVIMILDANGLAEELGSETQREADALANMDQESKAPLPIAKDAILIFKAGGRPHPRAVPLALVSRIEEIPADAIEWSGKHAVVQLRDELVPVVCLNGRYTPIESGKQAALIFADHGEIIALAVDEVVDIIEANVALELCSDDPERLGTAVVAGKATELIDVAHLFTVDMPKRGASTRRDGAATGARVLVIDDSPFFRNMLTPLLSAAGYQVKAAASVDDALSLRAAGETFDLILSDIEMPGKSGLDFARNIRSGGSWSDLPLVALSSLSDEQDMEAGLQAGFDRYVAKFDRKRLLELLEESVKLDEEAAA
ncbi:chemotaxis protein CheW [Pacificimonas sp. WHA3]|uniref:Chemotaxis protein CheW n=1 Tax=Pacificimonas pallii TaxID=2827236 RepID=A0ABS6SAF2_9SPHN|nr:chemotaxis protein CheW [Pacificimonas pallii]MBV7255180.1 chemotaxis protein CheW [Pacificimonas pallii]